MPNWHGILRGRLKPEAKNWSYFVGVRLIPVVSHSDIQQGRALGTYAILTGATINVGKMINQEMNAFCDGRSNEELDFPVLITQLCA